MKKTIIITAIVAVVCLAAGYLYQVVKTDPVVEEEPLQASASWVRAINFFAKGGTTTPMENIATTTSATSSNAAIHNITGAKKATFYFQRTGIYGNAGTSTFSIQVSRTASTTDDTDWITYNKLIDNTTNLTANNPTRVGSVALGNDMNLGTTTKMYSMDIALDVIKYIRCVVKETTDGEHICRALIQY